MEHEQIDFLAIGDVVTDAFIRLKDAEAHCDIDNHNCKLSLRFGDKVPYESVTEVCAVGNSGNAAVAAARLGIRTGLLAHIGKDYQGEKILNKLREERIDASLVQSHTEFPTNYHYVLWYDVERTILVKHAQFPYSLPASLAVPRMIYLSSMADHSLDYHHEIGRFVAAHPEIKLVFQPGTFQIKIDTKELADIYAHTYAFFCNFEEAQKILEMPTEKDVRKLIAGIHALGPKLVFITDGINGAYGSDGTEAWFMPIYPHDPYERTGAGDAFSSTVSVALLLGKSVPEALTWGPINSMSVVQYVGAQEGLLTQEKIEHFLKDAPADYKPSTVF